MSMLLKEEAEGAEDHRPVTCSFVVDEVRLPSPAEWYSELTGTASAEKQCSAVLCLGVPRCLRMSSASTE